MVHGLGLLGHGQGSQHNNMLHVQEPLDSVLGYFGMRKISVTPLPNNGPMFIHLNNKPIVQVGLWTRCALPSLLSQDLPILRS